MIKKDDLYYLDKLKATRLKYSSSDNADDRRYYMNIIYSLIYGVVTMPNTIEKDLIYKYICGDSFLNKIYLDLAKLQLKKADECLSLSKAINDVKTALDKIQIIISKM